jgi:hypothetical protein
MPKECGGCTVCCCLCALIDLRKPGGMLCWHAEPGKGCKIYARRPGGCRPYRCGWLAHDWLDEMLRPDRCGFLLDWTDDGKVVTVTLDHRRPVDADLLSRFLAQARQRWSVVLLPDIRQLQRVTYLPAPGMTVEEIKASMRNNADAEEAARPGVRRPDRSEAGGGWRNPFRSRPCGLSRKLCTFCLAPLKNGRAVCSDECDRGWRRLHPPLGDAEVDDVEVVRRVCRRKRDLALGARWHERQARARARSRRGSTGCV